ncbi:MAG: hypothetical protein H7A25_10045 [Leptospiraceae bacterium]|nr:hypothetical protein [Leptospiraceae bacterium]MCP5500232.1 hypothetical protein [Leptospiraceae bacterium]
MIWKEVFNQRIPGYIIFLCNPLRKISLIELRQGFNSEYDNVLNFYLDRMEESIHSRNIDLNKFEEVRELSLEYAEYEILYSTEELTEIKNSLPANQEYILIYSTDDIVNSYNSLKTDFYLKNNSSCFCLRKDIPELLEIQREHLSEYEHGDIFRIGNSYSES